MKAVICCYSSHHGNTGKVVQAMADESGADIIDISAVKQADLSEYDIIGFASGIYAFQFGPQALGFLRKNLPPNKKVFFVYTYGAAKGSGSKDITQAAMEKNAQILGEFSCKGYTTYGPFKLIGGLSKGHPNEADIQAARSFIHSIIQNS